MKWLFRGGIRAVIGALALCLVLVACGETKPSNDKTDLETFEEVSPDQESALCPNPIPLDRPDAEEVQADALIDGQSGEFRLKRADFHFLGVLTSGKSVAFRSESVVRERGRGHGRGASADPSAPAVDVQKMLCRDFTSDAVYLGAVKLPDVIQREDGSLTFRQHEFKVVGNGADLNVTFPDDRTNLGSYLRSLSSPRSSERIRFRIYRKSANEFEVRVRSVEFAAQGRNILHIALVYERR